MICASIDTDGDDGSRKTSLENFELWFGGALPRRGLSGDLAG